MTPVTISISATPDPEVDAPMRWLVRRHDGYVHIELTEIIRIGRFGTETHRAVLSVMTTEAGAEELLAALAVEAVTL